MRPVASAHRRRRAQRGSASSAAALRRRGVAASQRRGVRGWRLGPGVRQQLVQARARPAVLQLADDVCGPGEGIDAVHAAGGQDGATVTRRETSPLSVARTRAGTARFQGESVGDTDNEEANPELLCHAPPRQPEPSDGP